MSRLDSEAPVISLVRSLELEPSEGPVQQALDYCRARIDGWVAKHSPVATLADLEQLVCRRLSLKIEEIWTDQDLAALTREHVTAGETVFAAVGDSFDGETFATLVECLQKHPHGRRYVAVVDCRGAKANRRFFTRWHEIAHLLTLTGQLELPFHRSTCRGDALERLMDVIAGDIGFYEPIVRPTVESVVNEIGRLSFACVERIRGTACPSASLQATLIACVRRCPTPVVQVSAQMGLKAKEAEIRESGQMSILPSLDPQPKLRAAVAFANDAARAVGLRIDRNMEVPAKSIIWRLYHAGEPPLPDMAGTESLGIWKHSDGTSIGDSDVLVEARRSRDGVDALIQPLAAV